MNYDLRGFCFVISFLNCHELENHINHISKEKKINNGMKYQLL